MKSPHEDARLKLQTLAELHEGSTWADFDTVPPRHPLLVNHIVSHTYSIGCLREKDSKLITRAYPTIMTQLYFEFEGGLSEVKGAQHGFGIEPCVSINKRAYIKLGLGSWFDIFQLASNRNVRPIKNLKIDLSPESIYTIFGISPKELIHQDIQLNELMGVETGTLLLEEMEAAVTGEEMIAVAERYLLEKLLTNKAIRDLRVPVPAVPLPDSRLDHLTTDYGKSARWLQKRYQDVYGMTFKQMQSNLRFHRAHRCLWRSLTQEQTISLTELAYTSGYYDQAHFIKDFKHYTGVTPSDYLKSNFGEDQRYLWYW